MASIPYLRPLLSIMFALSAGAATGGDMTGVAKAELRPGWRMADGTHMAALHVVLDPGWKTYWRAPGDVGIPPQFDWDGSRNIYSVSTNWPTPEVFFEQGMRSIGYKTEVVVPLHLTAQTSGDMHLEGKVQIGVCKDICIPANLSVSATLTSAATRPDPVIAAALTDTPYTAREAGVSRVTCQIDQG